MITEGLAAASNFKRPNGAAFRASLRTMAESENGRRGALRVLIAGGSVAFGCALAAPAALFFAAPVRTSGGGAGNWVRTLKLDALPEGEPKKVAIVLDQRDAWTLTKNVELGAAWLIRRGDKVLALSVTCPHLGCSVNANVDATFACPCHTSAFDAAGKRTGGPSPRDMDPLATKIEDGFVLVQFRKYRMGTAERMETA
jgi:menaquinol-cytochrome c reductase iron-sulfur subunit